jgi:hypothetical protein
MLCLLAVLTANVFLMDPSQYRVPHCRGSSAAGAPIVPPEVHPAPLLAQGWAPSPISIPGSEIYYVALSRRVFARPGRAARQQGRNHLPRRHRGIGAEAIAVGTTDSSPKSQCGKPVLFLVCPGIMRNGPGIGFEKRNGPTDIPQLLKHNDQTSQDCRSPRKIPVQSE